MLYKNLLRLGYQFFAEGGASAGDSSAPSSAAGETAGDKPATSAGTEAGSAAGSVDNAVDPEKEYDEFIKAHKDIHTKRQQAIIDARFKETKELEDRAKKQDRLLRRIGAKYDWDGKDLSALDKAIKSDVDLIRGEAEKRGLPEDVMLELHNAQAELSETKYEQEMRYKAEEAAKAEQAWQEKQARLMAESDKLKAEVPGFDLYAESRNNPDFVRLINNGIPMEQAYFATHRGDVVAAVAQKAVAASEEATVKKIAANTSRPREGAGTKAAAQTNKSVASMSAAEILDIFQRSKRGEKITF